MLTSVILLTLVTLQSAKAIQSGSSQAYKAMANSQRGAIDDEIRARKDAAEWASVRKLSIVPQNPPSPRRSLILGKFENDQVGHIETYEFKVSRIVSDTETILRGTGFNDESVNVLLTDFNSADLADGDLVRLVGYVKVGEAKQVGKSAIRTIKFLTADESTKEEERKAAAHAAAVKANADQQQAKIEKYREAEIEKQFRPFNDKDGNYLYHAKFIEYKDFQVVLIKRGTKEEVRIKMTELSKDDVEWIRAELKLRKNANGKRK